ncbi:MAG: hypothetical protein AAF432_11030 [Planctomycetota bacterium]
MVVVGLIGVASIFAIFLCAIALCVYSFLRWRRLERACGDMGLRIVCPGCEYTLEGIRDHTETCPECGSALFDRKLTRHQNRHEARAIFWLFIAIITLSIAGIVGMVILLYVSSVLLGGANGTSPTLP